MGLMDIISSLPAKLFTDCGIAAWILGVFCVWLALQLAAARKVAEADRATIVRISDENNSAYEKLAAAQNTLQGILLGLQSRHSGDDN